MKVNRVIFKSIGVLLVSLSWILNASAAVNPYKKTSSFGPNCTWHAWQYAYEKAGVVLPGWGNANTWLDFAKKAGYETGMTPKAKSIAVWKWDKYGHVGYVEKVVGNTIYVWDSGGPCIDTENEEYKNCILNGVSEETDKECLRKYGKSIGCKYDASYWSVPGDLIGYIYLDKAPKKTTIATNNGTSKIEEKTPLKKSNNAFLKSLKVGEEEFSFKREIYKYEFVVKGDIDKIKIEAEADDAKANITGLKEYTLEIGINKIDIVVTAEDGTKKIYKLEITREDNNANLKNLEISGIELAFDKDINEYNVTVANDMHVVEVKGETESDKASVTGMGEYELKEGLNEISIKVTAQDKSEKIYKISIDKEKTEIKNEKREKVRESSNSIYYIIGGVIVILAGISGLLIKKRKKKN